VFETCLQTTKIKPILVVINLVTIEKLSNHQNFNRHTFWSSHVFNYHSNSPKFWVVPKIRSSHLSIVTISNCHLSVTMFLVTKFQLSHFQLCNVFWLFQIYFCNKKIRFFFLLSKIISIIKMYNIIWVQYKSPQLKTRGVSQCGLVIYIQIYHKAKEKLWKFQYFTIQNIFLKQNPLKKPKILQDITTL